MCLECYTGYPLIGLFNDTRKPWYSEDERLTEDGLNDYCSFQTNKIGTSSNHGDGLFNSKNTAVPRGAIMGGAVVAALASWRDPKIVALFQPLEKAIEALLLLSLSSEKKSNLACSGNAHKTKRRKKTNNNPSPSSDDYYNHTMKELKDILRSKNLGLGGKKADLVARIVNHDDESNTTTVTIDEE